MTYESGTLEPDSVRGMFDRIAPVYDSMNRVMTVGLDRRWRKLAVREAVWPGDRVLDACCGTGDLAVEAERQGGRVVGLDFSERMLERARRKSGAIEWIQGDALALPFDDEAFDAATVGFGVRNLVDLEAGLRELARVVRPGGKVAVLEITRPTGILRPFFGLWFDVLVPFAGRPGARYPRRSHASAAAPPPARRTAPGGPPPPPSRADRGGRCRR
jgi:demethylmenaquinone methyltransferase/2-methoxy-6-polyprenyl-1,4-benzoquinol methylase